MSGFVCPKCKVLVQRVLELLLCVIVLKYYKLNLKVDSVPLVDDGKQSGNEQSDPIFINTMRKHNLF